MTIKPIYLILYQPYIKIKKQSFNNTASEYYTNSANQLKRQRNFKFEQTLSVVVLSFSNVFVSLRLHVLYEVEKNVFDFLSVRVIKASYPRTEISVYFGLQVRYRRKKYLALLERSRGLLWCFSKVSFMCAKPTNLSNIVSYLAIDSSYTWTWNTLVIVC